MRIIYLTLAALVAVSTPATADVLNKRVLTRPGVIDYDVTVEQFSRQIEIGTHYYPALRLVQGFATNCCPLLFEMHAHSVMGKKSTRAIPQWSHLASEYPTVADLLRPERVTVEIEEGLDYIELRLKPSSGYILLAQSLLDGEYYVMAHFDLGDGRQFSGWQENEQFMLMVAAATEELLDGRRDSACNHENDYFRDPGVCEFYRNGGVQP